MSLVQCWPDPFDVACEDVCYESLSVHDFTRCRYCMPDTCEMHGLVQGNDGLCHANAGLRYIARHKESTLTRAPPGPTGALQWAPPNLGLHDGPNGTGAGGRAEAAVCARANTPARLPDVLSATQKCTTAASQRERMHIRLRLYKHE